MDLFSRISERFRDSGAPGSDSNLFQTLSLAQQKQTSLTRYETIARFHRAWQNIKLIYASNQARKSIYQTDIPACLYTMLETFVQEETGKIAESLGRLDVGASAELSGVADESRNPSRTVGACMEYCVNNAVFASLTSLCTSDFPFGIRIEILRFFSGLIKALDDDFLRHRSFNVPFFKLLKQCWTEDEAAIGNANIEIISLCLLVTSRCERNPVLVVQLRDHGSGSNSGGHASKVTSPRNSVHDAWDRRANAAADLMIVFDYLLKFIAHPAGHFLGDCSRTGILAWTRIRVAGVESFILEESQFLDVCSAAVTAAWANLPQLSPPDHRDQQHSGGGADSTLASPTAPGGPAASTATSLETLFALWEFLQRVLADAQQSVRTLLSTALKVQFLQNVFVNTVRLIAQETLEPWASGAEAYSRRSLRRVWELWAIIREMVRRTAHPALRILVADVLFGVAEHSSLRSLLLGEYLASSDPALVAVALSLTGDCLRHEPLEAAALLLPPLSHGDDGDSSLGEELYDAACRSCGSAFMAEGVDEYRGAAVHRIEEMRAAAASAGEVAAQINLTDDDALQRRWCELWAGFATLPADLQLLLASTLPTLTLHPSPAAARLLSRGAPLATALEQLSRELFAALHISYGRSALESVLTEARALGSVHKVEDPLLRAALVWCEALKQTKQLRALQSTLHCL